MMKAVGIVSGCGAPYLTSRFLVSDSTPLPNHHRLSLSFSSSPSPGSTTTTVTNQAELQHQHEPGIKTAAKAAEYKPGVFDDLFLNLFRSKLSQEVGWDSKKAGYDGLIEVANRLMMKGATNSDTIEATVRVLKSLFPPYLLELYKMLIAPINGGKLAAMMVHVERCKYLEESKCVGICINTCKFPTQAFFKDHMGVPLLMEPNFADYSCQFKFGVLPPLPDDDSVLKEPCLEACPNATRRRAVARNIDVTSCPKA